MTSSKKPDFFALFNQLSEYAYDHGREQAAALPLYTLGLSVELGRYRAETYAIRHEARDFDRRIKEKLNTLGRPDLEPALQSFLAMTLKGNVEGAFDRWLESKSKLDRKWRLSQP